MERLKFTVVSQPPYSPDLAQVVLLVVPKIEGDVVKGQRFSTNAEVQAAVRKWIRSQLESFYMDGMKKCIERLKKCVAVSADYVEK
ncbi:hypothetical protein TNCV_3854961 [Trichonephila clavipes]|nr:hypothetical protein TNCV_3854961 [Trichonephila clavipes]